MYNLQRYHSKNYLVRGLIPPLNIVYLSLCVVLQEYTCFLVTLLVSLSYSLGRFIRIQSLESLHYLGTISTLIQEDLQCDSLLLCSIIIIDTGGLLNVFPPSSSHVMAQETEQILFKVTILIKNILERCLTYSVDYLRQSLSYFSSSFRCSKCHIFVQNVAQKILRTSLKCKFFL